MDKEINGTLINSIEDYKKFVAKKHVKDWLTSSDTELYKVFGKPKKYPFIFIEMIIDTEPDWGIITKDLVKVYF